MWPIPQQHHPPPSGQPPPPSSSLGVAANSLLATPHTGGMSASYQSPASNFQTGGAGINQGSYPSPPFNPMSQVSAGSMPLQPFGVVQQPQQPSGQPSLQPQAPPPNLPTSQRQFNPQMLFAMMQQQMHMQHMQQQQQNSQMQLQQTRGLQYGSASQTQQQQQQPPAPMSQNYPSNPPVDPMLCQVIEQTANYCANTPGAEDQIIRQDRENLQRGAAAHYPFISQPGSDGYEFFRHCLSLQSVSQNRHQQSMQSQNTPIPPTTSRDPSAIPPPPIVVPPVSTSTPTGFSSFVSPPPSQTMTGFTSSNSKEKDATNDDLSLDTSSLSDEVSYDLASLVLQFKEPTNLNSDTWGLSSIDQQMLISRLNDRLSHFFPSSNTRQSDSLNSITNRELAEDHEKLKGDDQALADWLTNEVIRDPKTAKFLASHLRQHMESATTLQDRLALLRVIDTLMLKQRSEADTEMETDDIPAYRQGALWRTALNPYIVWMLRLAFLTARPPPNGVIASDVTSTGSNPQPGPSSMAAVIKYLDKWEGQGIIDDDERREMRVLVVKSHLPNVSAALNPLNDNGGKETTGKQATRRSRFDQRDTDGILASAPLDPVGVDSLSAVIGKTSAVAAAAAAALFGKPLDSESIPVGLLSTMLKQISRRGKNLQTAFVPYRPLDPLLTPSFIPPIEPPSDYLTDRLNDFYEDVTYELARIRKELQKPTTKKRQNSLDKIEIRRIDVEANGNTRSGRRSSASQQQRRSSTEGPSSRNQDEDSTPPRNNTNSNIRDNDGGGDDSAGDDEEEDEDDDLDGRASKLRSDRPDEHYPYTGALRSERSSHHLHRRSPSYGGNSNRSSNRVSPGRRRAVSRSPSFERRRRRRRAREFREAGTGLRSAAEASWEKPVSWAQREMGVGDDGSTLWDGKGERSGLGSSKGGGLPADDVFAMYRLNRANKYHQSIAQAHAERCNPGAAESAKVCYICQKPGHFARECKFGLS